MAMPDPSGRFPAVFVSHGSPMIAIEDEPWGRALGAFAASLPRPRAVAVVSGHWEAPAPVRITGSAAPPTIHDFGGFPEALYRVRYPALGARDVGARAMALLETAGISAAIDPERGLDHGAWVPLRFLYPDADVPVLEISQPEPRSPESALAMGAALSPLRDEGVLLLGTGGVVHNLRRILFDETRPLVVDWAGAFDAWFGARLAAMDVYALASYRSQAPRADLAVPTPEHFDPIFVVLGAARPGERATTLYEGFRYGTLSMRSFAIGPATA